MKTRNDKTISIIIIVYGLIFIFPLLILSNFKLTTFSILWICFSILIILFGFWKIETFEITDNRLTKTNFFGLFKRTINLQKLIRYDKKVIDTDHFKNPFNIVKFFSKDNKYLVFRQITITTDKGSKLKLDERTIKTEDFNMLYNKIKAIKNRQTN